MLASSQRRRLPRKNAARAEAGATAIATGGAIAVLVAAIVMAAVATAVVAEMMAVLTTRAETVKAATAPRRRMTHQP